MDFSLAVEYPGLPGTSDGEWEIRGYPNSRESVLNEVRMLTSILEVRGVEIPDLDPPTAEECSRKSRVSQGSEGEGMPRRSVSKVSRKKSTSGRKAQD